MFKIIYQAVVSTTILGVLVCGVYPLAVTLCGRVLFPNQVEGSLIRNLKGEVLGSKLIGQNFSKPEYFHGRPSAAGDKGYDASNSSGSNLALTNQKFADTLKANIETALTQNPGLSHGQVPNDLVTASGSGLDPHLSPEGVNVQIARVAGARHLDPSQVRALVDRHTEGPELGFLGESTVNVLELNLALDSLKQ
jgi:K+-transporting ATPase ATPase C chain